MKFVRHPLIVLSVLASVLILPSLGRADFPTRCVLEKFPYVQQIRNYCGPASLTTVLSFWGLKTDQKTVGQSVFDSSIQATNGADMLLYARAKGYSAYSWNSDLKDLKQKLATGVPVIVLQDSSTSDPSGHYRVAIGYDEKDKVIYVSDPYDPNNKKMAYNEFMQLWSPHGNWSLLVCPSDKDAFKSELDEKNPVVHLDLAYIHYKHGDFASSERESRLALALEPANDRAKSLLSQAIGARGKSSKAAAN